MSQNASKMSMKKFLFFLLLCSRAISASVDLCVLYECENCFSVRVLKIDSLVNKPQWNLKDSIECECGMWFPPSFEIPELPEPAPSGSGGTCVSIEKKGNLMKMPPVPEITLQDGDVVYSSFFSDRTEEIHSKYKHAINLLWKVRFGCPGDQTKDTTLIYKIKANLVGECPKQ